MGFDIIRLNLSWHKFLPCFKNIFWHLGHFSYNSSDLWYPVSCACLVMQYHFYPEILDKPQCGLKESKHLLDKHKITELLVPFYPLWSLIFYQSISLISRVLIGRSNIFRVGVGEAEEIVLVQVHDDKLVCWSQVHWHLGELLVKVASVPTVPLQMWFMRLWRKGNVMGGRIKEKSWK